MKRILIIGLFLVLLLAVGCEVFDLGGFILPENNEFEILINGLNTPELICEYMENFDWNISVHTYSPYQMYLANLESWNNTGDCDDFATFGVFVANLHKYETYRVLMWCKFTGFYGLPLILPHVIAIYVEDNKLTYSTNQHYVPLYADYDDFEAIIAHFEFQNYKVIRWRIADYNGNLVERGDK